MFAAFTLFVFVLCVLTWRHGGPVRALAIAWLVCLAPVALNVISYGFQETTSDRYLWLLAFSILAFVAGSMVGHNVMPSAIRGSKTDFNWDDDFAKWLPFAKACLLIAAIANFAAIMNFNSAKVSAENLNDIRAQVIDAREGVGLLERIAAVTTWACFVCLSFGVYFRHKLSGIQTALFIAMSLGLFLSSLSSAGRQSVMQFILFIVLLEAVRNRRMPKSSRSRGNRGFLALLASLAVSVIVFVTVNRLGDTFRYKKGDLLLVFFNAKLSNWFEDLIYPLSTGVRTFMIESVLYLSSSVPLFSRFLDIDFGRLYFGVFDFPFIMRQLEPMTGISVIGAWDTRVRYLGSEHVIGSGWTTTPSHLMLDFGVIGMMLFLFIQGMVSEMAWKQVRHGGGFGITLVCVVLTVAAIYMPFLPAISDTNIFLLLVVMVAMLVAKRSAAKRNSVRGQASQFTP